MRKLFNFLSYAMLMLVALLGAYIVFHMWFLSERFRHKDSPGPRQSERTAGGNAQSVLGARSEEAKTTVSPSQE
jgi:hypothetical protein